ncbi:MAG: NAD(P)/FAD-dependent oxidoreductase [Spirochaetes bacterium]|nr:NAD(P)/FAD-dependent oxidoreductase [Spirochaetota bacterium]
MKLVVDNIRISPFERNPNFEKILKEKFPTIKIAFHNILRRSLDARKKSAIVYKYRLLCEVDESDAKMLLRKPHIFVYREKPTVMPQRTHFSTRPLIVGSGPAGLFAALWFAESGIPCDIIERGKPVDQRMEDIKKLEGNGILNCESNIVFGEGGAGAYSDGKLTARTHREEAEWFFKKLVEFGAPQEILYEAKPHIGTDKLVGILKALRQHLISKGVEFHFQTRLEDIETSNGKVCGIKTSNGKFFSANIVILATGHSARDVYEMLLRKGIRLEKKGFAVGVRVEHPREMIDEIQFGKEGTKAGLISADYFLVHRNRKSGRGVYTFCMCPGGYIINSSSENEHLCTNGMSHSRRDSRFSNAAIVVTIFPQDFSDNPLAGLAFQRELEKKAFRIGGEKFVAPAQRIPSFLKRKLDATLPTSSYKPACIPARVDEMLPEMIYCEIAEALKAFNKKMPGFVSDEGVIVGVETRTSSPVRILRRDDYQSESVEGLYPVGEGAGYAGGIVSSAVDGIRVARCILEKWSR